ncbi:MAG: L-glutamate gamma-semialdehyde dehydrogenase [Sphingomonadales bacterium]|jgi:RHH-type proline utilization regulon transcriptional repressor/proline dehydrogenase/delta 1-pyrroline-5-carboxylate dehydrogenase|nr:L-glutamate gamma-semialdehyde dehydrogenase [Sphingomonadales bacterium]MBK9269112.1 L-glutamate gamma-semialdehyde dehydrogenase [Sphingomonadales bacterium]MBP6433528.1 L-glutamate gamma-semialdehyde dehydrogenase [Sphingorhabdus sp.]
MANPVDSARAAIRPMFRASEPETLAPLVAAAQLSPAERDGVVARARDLLGELRAAQTDGWVNQFLQEYRLGTEEGTALLSLAEAFLRVPDADTADLLIADKLGDANWRAHSGKSASLLVNGATWGLVLGKAMVGDDGRGVLRKLVSRAGEPFVRQAVGAAMRLMGQVFVMGRTIDEAIKRMDTPENEGFTASFDMLGEAARTRADAERYFEAYRGAIAAVGANPARGHSVSVKLSALHPRYETAKAASCVPELSAMLVDLARQAAGAAVQLTVDAEEAARLEMSLDIIEAAARDPQLKGWDGLGMAVQAYSKRARPVLAWADALGRDTGRIMQVRLVKGAYWDSEIKWAQERGLSDYPLFTRKPSTDVSYLACAKDMLRAANIRPAFATHNALTVGTILEWAGQTRDFEFQRLHGMGQGLFERLVQDEGYHCRIYAPVGGHRDLLAYLVRRLLENGANSSFVHQLADEEVSEDELLADPVEKVMEVGGTRHPAIRLPAELFAPQRANSEGMDLEDADVLAGIAAKVAAMPAVPDGIDTDVKTAIAAAEAAYPSWSATPVEERAACLERLADLLEEHRAPLMAIAVQEAKKTIPDALAEVREAVDFCRYYAARARHDMQPVELPGPTGERNVLRYEGHGVWAAIAPWNFPLAIFLGQVVAALVSGNTVVAKPAPQTPAIARYAIDLARKAGIPAGAIQIVTGGGDIGQVLLGDRRIVGTVFTGSVPTAKAIARNLLTDDARPLVPLIAETGGLNAMFVDSTALSEQVVRDVVISGFQSAGQRCSALRLLLLQEQIAEHTIDMLVGAMQELVVGDPANPANDIGPVIDKAAYDRLMAYRQTVADRIVFEVPVPSDGLYVPPTLVRLNSLDEINTEWFGPIVHVATWPAGKLEETIAAVNAKGFGLTMGLHSRIARVSEAVEGAARVGNLYINRSMIGAVVGSQPFGGEGLSGTGPKAGGPNYLHRFCAERTTSIDTTSAGGNASLLSLED